MKMYLQVRIENHWTVPPDEPPPPSVSPPPKRVFSLHSAEGFLKSLCNKQHKKMQLYDGWMDGRKETQTVEEM